MSSRVSSQKSPAKTGSEQTALTPGSKFAGLPAASTNELAKRSSRGCKVKVNRLWNCLLL